MTNRICKISLFTAILACVSYVPVNAAVKAKNSNRSYAAGYQQVNNLRYQQEYANTSAAASLPVAVDDEVLASSIINNGTGAPSVSDLEACSRIYLNGNFKWAVPEYGFSKEPQCVAVVELIDANTSAVLATTTVAAGQAILCNIDSFPQSGYNTSALSKIKELPADRAPTMEDVIQVMNQEQKQNAGIKIAAGAIIAGVAGNLLGQKEAGAKEGKIPLGTGKTQLISTAVGAAAGAGIMAASSYSGKVAGDTIKSTAVNAASGMLIGNMLAGASGGDSVLANVKCSVNGTEHDCIVGTLRELGQTITSNSNEFYLISSNGGMVKKCENKEKKITCDNETMQLTNIRLETGSGTIKFDDVKKENTQNIVRYEIDKDIPTDEYYKQVSTSSTATGEFYFKISSAQEAKNPQRAYAVFDNGVLKNKPFGFTKSDWEKLKANATYYTRYNDGSVGPEIKQDNETPTEFSPSSRDAEDGGLIDISNQARAKGTIVGTAAGGALGGFAGYQGAKDEVSERWVSALQEYEAALYNFQCMTGKRPLATYNENAIIPELHSEQ